MLSSCVANIFHLIVSLVWPNRKLSSSTSLKQQKELLRNYANKQEEKQINPMKNILIFSEIIVNIALARELKLICNKNYIFWLMQILLYIDFIIQKCLIITWFCFLFHSATYLLLPNSNFTASAQVPFG